jgi:hypothetical protein
MASTASTSRAMRRVDSDVAGSVGASALAFATSPASKAAVKAFSPTSTSAPGWASAASNH